jgi:hypothetical protein
MAVKEVTSSHYHLWTDALHARELARQANNEWDRGTYVRWSITTAWTAFEMSCADAVGATGLGMRFKDEMDRAIDALGLARLKWGQGLWQDVLEIYAKRKDYTHVNANQSQLFSAVNEAENAIGTLRQAIKEVYNYVGKQPPGWEDDDVDRGWDSGSSSFASLSVIHAGVDESDPNVVRVAFVYKGREYISDILSPGTDPQPFVYNLRRSIRAPISAIRVYRGQEMEETQLTMVRGL